MYVRNYTLLILATIIWFAAGFNVFFIGIKAIHSIFGIVTACVFGGIVFLCFQRFVFVPMVRRHEQRILSYPLSHNFFLKFFDLKSFLIMFFMIGLGVTVRYSGKVPDSCIAPFYSGLGLALMRAGILFARSYNEQRKKTQKAPS